MRECLRKGKLRGKLRKNEKAKIWTIDDREKKKSEKGNKRRKNRSEKVWEMEIEERERQTEMRKEKRTTKSEGEREIQRMRE